MATAIDQNTIQTYDIYRIIIDENPTEDGPRSPSIPLNAFYLVPYLKNDSNEMSKYDGSNAISIKNKTFFNLGDKNFDVTINVVEHELTATDFIQSVLFFKYPSIKEQEQIINLLSILPCTKALYLGMLCILLNAGDYPDDQDAKDPILDRMQALADLYDIKETDIYDFVLGELMEYINNTNPINAEDYYPKIQYEQMKEPYEKVKDHEIHTYTNFQINTNYSNVVKINSNNFTINNEKLKNIHDSFMNIERVYAKDADTRYREPAIMKVEDGPTNNDKVQTKFLTLRSFPESLFKVEKNRLINTTKHCMICLQPGFKVRIREEKGDWWYKDWYHRIHKNYDYYVFTVPAGGLTLGPGEGFSFPIQAFYDTKKKRTIEIENPGSAKILLTQKEIEWNFEIEHDIKYKNLKKYQSTSDTYIISSLDNLKCLKTDKDKHTITNTTSTLQITIPKNEKYYCTGMKTITVSHSKVINTVVTVAVTIMATITSIVKGIFKWLTSLVTRQEPRTTFVEEVRTTVEKWTTTETYRKEKDVTITKNIVINPGETYTFKTPDDVSDFNNKIYLVTGTKLIFKRNYNYVDNFKVDKNIKISSFIIDDPSTTNDKIKVTESGNKKKVTLTVPMIFQNDADNRHFSTNDGEIFFEKDGLTLNKYSSYTNIFGKKKDSLIGILLTTLFHMLINPSSKESFNCKVKLESDNTKEQFTGESNPVYFDYRPVGANGREYTISKTNNVFEKEQKSASATTGVVSAIVNLLAGLFEKNKNNLVIRIPTALGKLSSTNNFGLIRPQKCTLTYNKNEFDTIMRNDILSNIRQLTDTGKVTLDARLEENVIYHVNKIRVKPRMSAIFTSGTLLGSNRDIVKTDLQLLVDNTTFTFQIVDNNNKVVHTVACDTVIKNITTNLSGIVFSVQPGKITNYYDLDVSMLKLYYYNGTIYKK